MDDAELMILWSRLNSMAHVLEDLSRHAKGTATLAERAQAVIQENIRTVDHFLAVERKRKGQ
jgi:hypothetical protein